MEMHNLHDSWRLQSVSKERKVIFYADSDTSVSLRVSQMPGSSKVVIFLLTTTANNNGRQQSTDRRQTKPIT